MNFTPSFFFLFGFLFLVSSEPSTEGYQHTNNWAVIVCSSRFWFNYRHVSNALSVYRTVQRLGIPDDQILLLLAEDVACNPRNIFPNTVYNQMSGGSGLNLYGEKIEVDYRGHEVDSETFLRLLTGRHDQDTPRSKRLLTDDRSNILIFMTGHGGDGFLKFQDKEELNSDDLADAVEAMYRKGRYGSILMMFDTCQASTLFKKIYSPNVIGVGSSKLGESSYSHENDYKLGLSLSDRFTYYILQYFENKVRNKESNETLMDLFQSLDFERLHSHVEWNFFDFSNFQPGRGGESLTQDQKEREIRITEFFGSAVEVEISTHSYPLNFDAE